MEVNDIAGAWAVSSPVQFGSGVQSTAPNTALRSVSCSSAGNCTAVGLFNDVSGANKAFVVTESGGTWSSAAPTNLSSALQSNPTNSNFNAVSCTSNGDCAALGEFTSSSGTSESFYAVGV